MKIKNAAYFKGVKIPGFEAFGRYLSETLNYIGNAHDATSQGTNVDPDGGQLPAPPQVSGLQVSSRDGYVHVAIQDRNQSLYRSPKYYVVHADNPQLTNAIQEGGTEGRNITFPIGNQTRYIGVFHAYPNGAPSPVLMHGGAIPKPVFGGGAGSGPLFLPSEGSGTGSPGVAGQGPGSLPYRGQTTVPPIR